MLGRNYRFSVNNQCGVNVTVTIQCRKWKFDSSGALEYSSEVEEFNESAIASSSTAWTEDAAVDNDNGGADLYIGADLEVVVTPASSVTNTGSTNVTVQIQRSTDGGTTWPDDGRGQIVDRFNIPTGSSATTWATSIGM